MFSKDYLITDDLGFFDDAGYLRIIGRNSHKIVTGGENVFPTEVESAILATGLVKDVCVIGIPDSKWGQAVTAIFVPNASEMDFDLIRNKLQSYLAPYKIPKHGIALPSLYRNAQGKIDYYRMRTLVKNFLQG